MGKHNPITQQPHMEYRQQPLLKDKVVIQSQPTLNNIVASEPEHDWSTGLFDCFQDINNCLCITFFGDCVACCMAKRMGESPVLPICVPGGIITMRSVFRKEHNIQGSILDDCCVSTFCGHCMLCQLSREMDYMNYPPQNSCC